MVIILPGEVLVNVAHISLISGIQELDDGSGRHFIRILLQGKHWTNAAGTPDEIQKLYGHLKNAIAQVPPVQ